MNRSTAFPSESVLPSSTPSSVGRGDWITASLPWIAPLIVFGGACITVGILWDISWHSTIGRDTFWTPAHMMIYVGGALSGCLAGWLAIVSTFLRREAMLTSSVAIGPTRAPLGAWICIWGAAAMLTSAPLDDWWHNAYGLDVKILSPPHALLALGMYGVVTGSLFLTAAARNRSTSESGAALGGHWVILANGIQLALASILLTEKSFPNLQHTATFAKVSAAMYPAFLMAAATCAATRFAATKVSLVYMAIQCGMIWILPLFAAEPKLAPIFNRVTHMVPPAFPLLLIVPALCIDGAFLLIRNREGWGWNSLRVVGGATLFLAAFLPVQWYFSTFLISPAANNAFFAGHSRFFHYASDLSSAGVFWGGRESVLNTSAVGWAWVIALVSAGVGLAAGGFLRKVRR